MARDRRSQVRWTKCAELDKRETGRDSLYEQEEDMTQAVLVIGGVLLAAGMAYGQAETPGIDQRQANQEQRIDQGIASGQLTQREAGRLEQQQQRIDTMENKAKSDGVVTNKERTRIHAAQDKASKKIYRQKHDRQKSRHQ
jgi:uncharacterized membrane protein YebE (DUF533 family)